MTYMQTVQRTSVTIGVVAGISGAAVRGMAMPMSMRMRCPRLLAPGGP